MPRLFLLLLLLEFAALPLLLLEPAFEELGEDVAALFDAALGPVELVFALLLLLFELLPPPELEDPEDPPEDCFSFLSLIIIYTIVDHSTWSLF